MAISNRRQTFSDLHSGRLTNRPDNIKSAKRRATDSRNHGFSHDDENDTDHDTKTFSVGTRTIHNRTYTRTPASRYRQSTTRQQRPSTREEYHGNPFQDHLFAYKTQLVNNLNAQINRADHEITQRMDNLGEEFDGHLKIIEEAGGRFWAGLGEEMVQICVGNGEDGDYGQKRIREITLDQVMTDLEKLMDLKRARLVLLTADYARVRAESVKLAIAILGEEKISLVEPGSKSIEDNTQKAKVIPGGLPTQAQPSSETNTDAATTTPTAPIDQLDQIYTDAESGLTDLQIALDELVSRILEENKSALKAFQAGRKVKQSELSTLLSSWSFV